MLGAVSLKTLYRWHKALKAGDDKVAALMPAYKAGKLDRAPKLYPDEKRMLEKLLLNPKRVKLGTAAELIRYCLKDKGQDCHSKMTLRRYGEWLQRNRNDIWTLTRESEKSLTDNVAPYIQRSPELLNVGQVLVADGHRLNFLVKYPSTGKPCRATLIVYVDWKSFYLAGWEIMASPKQLRMIEAMWADVSRAGTYAARANALKQFLHRFGVYGGLKAVTIYQARKIVTALQTMKENNHESI